MKLQGIITATVAVILIMLVAVPLIDSSSESIESTAQNTDARYMMSSTSSEPVTLEFAQNSYKINGVEYQNVDNYQIKAFCNKFFLSFNVSGSTATINDNTNYSIYNISKLEYDPSNSTATAYHSGGNTTYTDVEKLFYLHPNGDYAYFASAGNIHVSNNAEWFALISAFSAENGTVWEIDKYTGQDKSVYLPGFIIPSSGSGSAATISYTLTFDQVDSKHFDITNASDATSNGMTFSGIKFVVPVEYLEISENDGVVLTLIGLIPVLLIAALLIGIGYSIMRRD